MNIVKINSESLTLSSGLSQEAFAKTNFTGLLSEKSLLLHFEKNQFNIEEYYFSGTRADENGITAFEGKKVNGKLLSDILAIPKQERSQNENFSILVFSKAIDFLTKNADFSENLTVGGGGILIHTNSEKQNADILFINSELFEICAQNQKADYGDLQGKFIYKGLDALSSLYFLRAAVAYKAITNHFPFEEADTTKRQEDIFDSNFIPLELWNSEINENLRESIHAALSLRVTDKILAGKRNLTDAKAEAKKQKLLKIAKTFDSEKFFKEIFSCAPLYENDSLSEKRNSFTKKMKKFLAAKRFLRRNKKLLFTIGAVALVVLWFLNGFLEQNSKLITTKGLSSLETTHALYTEIHRADIPNLQEVISGKGTKDLMFKMSGYYVNSKQRLQVSPDNGVLTPEKWFFYKKGTKNWILGLTNLKIDGKSFKIEADFKQKKDKPLPIIEENDNILKKGDECTHSAEYFFIHQAESKIFIEKMSDTVTLRWTGKQWKVIKVDGNSEINSIKSKDFIEEYYALLEENNVTTEEFEVKSEESKISPALKKLREKYDWIPNEADFMEAANFLFSKYGSIEAEKFLKME